MRFLTVLVLLLLLLPLHAALAWTADATLTEPAQEARARGLFVQLRCLSCEGQSIADSAAMLAQDMRAHVRSRIAEGAADEAILAEFRGLYGNDVLMSPEGAVFSGSLFHFLWLLPFPALAAAFILQRRRPRA